MNENIMKLKEVLSDEAFVKTVLEAENEEAVQKMLADKGVELSLTEIEIMGETLEAVKDGKISMEQIEKMANAGELSEDELEEAAGGDWFYNVYKATFDEHGNLIDEAHIEQALKAGKNISEQIFHKSLNKGHVAITVAAGVAAIVAIGYGIYDAVRRRW